MYTKYHQKLISKQILTYRISIINSHSTTVCVGKLGSRQNIFGTKKCIATNVHLFYALPQQESQSTVAHLSLPQNDHFFQFLWLYRSPALNPSSEVTRKKKVWQQWKKLNQRHCTWLADEMKNKFEAVWMFWLKQTK